MIGRIGFVDAVGEGLPDPFEKAALVRYWNALYTKAMTPAEIMQAIKKTMARYSTTSMCVHINSLPPLSPCPLYSFPPSAGFSNALEPYRACQQVVMEF